MDELDAPIQLPDLYPPPVIVSPQFNKPDENEG